MIKRRRMMEGLEKQVVHSKLPSGVVSKQVASAPWRAHRLCLNGLRYARALCPISLK